MQADSSRKNLFQHKGRLALVAVLIAGLGLFAWRSLGGPQVETLAAQSSDILQSIVASGRVEAPLRVNIGSQVTGTVAAIPVAEGQDVKAGQRLIELENAEAKAAVEQARATLRQAEARVKQVAQVGLPAAQQTLLQANVTLATARRNVERLRELRAQGFIGQSQLDDAEQRYELAQSQHRAAQIQVDTYTAGGSDAQLAEAALAQARAALAAAEARLRNTLIEAPAAGTLIARNVERGDVVQPGKALMVLSPAGRTQLVVLIDEKNLSQLALGQKALASADAFPDRRFDATLAYINPAVDPARGSVEVKLDVPQPPDYLRQDMTVSVDIVTGRREKVTVIPLAAVHDLGSPAPWVMKLVDGRAQRTPVMLGLRGRSEVEVVKGVAPGDLLVPATSTVGEGKHVRQASASAQAGGK